MKTPILAQLLFLGVIVAACGSGEDQPSADQAAAAMGSNMVVLDDSLQQLKDDFNSEQGKVRLLFLSGPTCGICLRGMADLNDAFVAVSQNDERLATFIVHVPTMGAELHHAEDSMPLLDGPRILHYWEETGIIGQHFQEVMDVQAYVWDFWAIYGPEARWEGVLPPVPAYYEHQLGATSGRFVVFPKERRLDAQRFAVRTMELVDDLGRITLATESTEQGVNEVADGTVIPKIGQPRSVIVRQHIMGRGGYRNLKRIRSISRSGKLSANGDTYEFASHATRPDRLRRTLVVDGVESVAEMRVDGDISLGSASSRGISAELEELLLSSFEFDGLLVEWPDKGHEVATSGMQKIGDVLAWRLSLAKSDGTKWQLFLDSHTGDLVRTEIFGADDEIRYTINRSDFKEVAGIRFAHRIEYLDDAGQSLAVEDYDLVEIESNAFEIEPESVSH